MLLVFLLPVLMSAEDPRMTTLKDRSEGMLARQIIAKSMVKDRVLEVGPVLETILKNTKEEDRMRIFAMRQLGELGYREAGPVLIDITKNKDLSVDFRKVCVEAVGAINDKQLFLDMGMGILLRDDVANVLSKTYLDILEKSRFRNDPEILVVLGQFMSAGVKDYVKDRAMGLLSESPGKETLTLLMIALSDKNPEVRKKAIVTVAKAGQGDAVTLFISKLEEETNAGVRAVLAEELDKLPAPKLRHIWIADLLYWMTEEPRADIKKNLASALEKLKAANQGAGSGGPDISMPRTPRPPDKEDQPEQKTPAKKTVKK